MRTTSSSRGSSITATSDPPAKITWPLHHEKSVADEVGAERAELLGRRASSRARARRWPTSPSRRRSAGARPSAAVTIRVTAIGDMALTTTPGRRVPAELPGERRRRPAWRSRRRRRRPAATPTEVTPRIRPCPAAAMIGSAAREDVEVAVEVHGEHAAPVLLGARGEARRPGDAGHVDHRVEPAVLVDQLVEQLADRRRRRSPRPTRPGPSRRRRRCDRRWSPRAPGAARSRRATRAGPSVTTKAPCAAELLGDGGADPAAAAGDDDDPLAGLRRHGAATWSSSSRPSQSPLVEPLLEQLAVARSSRRSPGRSCRCAGSAASGLPSWLIRDGVQADMTALPSTNESTIFWVQRLLGLGAHVEHLHAPLARGCRRRRRRTRRRARRAACS